MSRTRLVLVLASLTVFGCSNASKTEAPAPAPTPVLASSPMKKDPAAAKAMIAAGATVIDVRTPGEYGEGHVDKATNIPVQEFGGRIAEVDKLVGGDKTKPVVVYCAAGKRAHSAQQQLEALGYTHVVNGGGYDDLH